MNTFIADVIQFIRPDGRKEYHTFKLPIEVEAYYKDMVDNGCRLESEVLTTGDVSVTISDGESDLDISLSQNNFKLSDVIADMLKRQPWKKQNEYKNA